MSRAEVLIKCGRLAFDGFWLFPPEQRYEFSRSNHSEVLPHLLVPAVAMQTQFASLTLLQVQNIKADR
jgi:hypothetical protein